MAAPTPSKAKDDAYLSEEEEDEDDVVESWDDWNADEDDESANASDFNCLFCDSSFLSSNSVFDHCAADHQFDFQGIRKCWSLDFYGSFKLINYVRQMVCHYYQFLSI